MSNPPLGQHGHPNEPQCYNCGTVGHWAVACPEPTRETPAGLAAWRNSSSSGPSQSYSRGSGPASNKRSKGPIITKYAPPPPPPALGQGMSYLPPPPGHHPHPPLSYPGQPPSYQTYAPSPPPTAYGGSFAPQSYSYAPPQNLPPPAHGASHFAPPGYMGHPPPLGPPPGTHFSPRRVDGHEHMPPARHAQPFSQSPPALNRSRSQSDSRSAKPAGLPPKPPPGIVSHPLPPKPPKSHDKADNQRDHKHKRKHDRHHNKPTDRRQSNDHHNYNKQHLANAVSLSYPPHSPENRRSSGSRKGSRQNHSNANSKNHATTAGSPPRPQAGSKTPETSRRHSNGPTPHTTAGDGNDRRSDGDEHTMLRIHSGAYSNETMRSKIGKESKAEKRSSLHELDKNSGDIGGRALSDSHSGDKHASSERDRSQERQAKRQKTEASPWSEPKKHTDDEEDMWDHVPREADRRQQGGRARTDTKRRGSTGSRASRHSSQSSHSSDLNSLEAELLGRPVKQKSPDRASAHHRPEHRDHRMKPKRRQANSNSAYSRRW